MQETAGKEDVGRASDEPLVSLRGLTKVFRDFWGRPKVRAVDGLDLDIMPG